LLYYWYNTHSERETRASGCAPPPPLLKPKTLDTVSNVLFTSIPSFYLPPIENLGYGSWLQIVACYARERGVSWLMWACPRNLTGGDRRLRVCPLVVSLATSSWYDIRTLAGEWPKYSHSSIPCSCQSPPVGIFGECKISNWTGCCGSQCWNWAVVIPLSILTNACQHPL
jgi:hypothetical protein